MLVRFIVNNDFEHEIQICFFITISVWNMQLQVTLNELRSNDIILTFSVKSYLNHLYNWEHTIHTIGKAS